MSIVIQNSLEPEVFLGNIFNIVSYYKGKIFHCLDIFTVKIPISPNNVGFFTTVDRGGLKSFHDACAIKWLPKLINIDDVNHRKSISVVYWLTSNVMNNCYSAQISSMAECTYMVQNHNTPRQRK